MNTDHSIPNSALLRSRGKTCMINWTMPVTATARIDQTRAFALEIARLAGAHCSDVVLLDVRGISPITDFFVIGTGSSARLMRSVCDEAEELGIARGYRAMSNSGYDGENWLLTDFFDLVLHLFSPTSRTFYDLDGLWGDAPLVPWQPASN